LTLDYAVDEIIFYEVQLIADGGIAKQNEFGLQGQMCEKFGLISLIKI
jgi:hypothetical protein